jgi:hypothetical protein
VPAAPQPSRQARRSRVQLHRTGERPTLHQDRPANLGPEFMTATGAKSLDDTHQIGAAAISPGTSGSSAVSAAAPAVQASAVSVSE